MSFDATAKQQFCFDLSQDIDTRDSGIVADHEEMNIDSENSLPSQWRPTVSSPGHVFFDLDEGIEDLELNEIAKSNENGASFASSLRQLKEHGFSKDNNSHKMLMDVTNKSFSDESPKSHFTNLRKRSRLHDFNFNVNKRTSKMYSTSEIQTVRKRNLEFTPIVQRKKKDVRSDGDKSSVTCRAQQRNLHSFMRVQSSCLAEIGASRSARNNLPHFLNVDYSLETVKKPQIESVAFKSISGDVVAKLMTSMSEEEFSKKFILIDCRYPYEYNGGHLKGAINIFDMSRVTEIFFPESEDQFRETSSKIPIFYCEYSQKRGPRMAHALRKIDRERNEARYPEVDYKEIYLLDRGYKKFFEEDRHVHLCEPQSYTRMIASSHKEDLKRYQMHKSKSTTSIVYNPSAQRDLLKVRNRFTSSFDGLSKENENSAYDSINLSPSNRKPCRGNMFGSPFTPPKDVSPEQRSLKPVHYGSYS